MRRVCLATEGNTVVLRRIRRLSLPILVCASTAALSQGSAGAGSQPVALKPTPAAILTTASQSMILGADWAGARTVAVGDLGIILLSDDEGRTTRQAKTVPISSTLTSVAFVDERRGWAVGHWGAILATQDGGESWQVQRLAVQEDRPLFSVHFFDKDHGVAVGLWSLVLTTDDAGKSWTQRTIPAPPGSKKADLNLLGLFTDGQDTLYAAAERGMVLKSDDHGSTWTYLETGGQGSLWCGTALDDKVLLVGGQRGAIYRSADHGATWSRIDSGGKSSITSFVHRGPLVLAVGLDGYSAVSKDGGQTFEASERSDRLSLTTALASPSGKWLIWSRRGVTADAVK
jgi:photosystem II stability/assembly factor-like uncharacterized protein